MQNLVRILIPVLILAIGFGAWKWLGIPIDEPVPQQTPSQRLQTEKTILNPTDYPVIIESQGIVQAQYSATLTPLVSGTIIKIHPAFEDGAFFNENDVLIELDPADLKTAVLAAESRLARAEAALIQEKARANQARANWEDIGFNEEPSPLVLRIPQLREAEAIVSSTQADLDQSERNLDRAKVKAPFNGRVAKRLVGLGQSINAASPLGEVFATSSAEIRIPLSPAQLPFVNLPASENDAPVRVVLTDALADPSQPAHHQWIANIIRTEGTLDPQSRELFVIARIDDPFSLNSDLPELRIGQPLRAAIDGITLKDVFVIPRSAMRGINRIFLIDKQDPKIIRKDINPIWSNNQVVIVANELNPSDWLATSRLPYAPDDAPVEIVAPPPAEEAAGPAGKPEPGDS
jgi:RND family efflux transporter MFP subunit